MRIKNGLYQFHHPLLLLEAEEQGRVKYRGDGLYHIAFHITCVTLSQDGVIAPQPIGFRVIFAHEVFYELCHLSRADQIYVVEHFKTVGDMKAMTEDDSEKCAAMFNNAAAAALKAITDYGLTYYGQAAAQAVDEAVKHFVARWN